MERHLAYPAFYLLQILFINCEYRTKRALINRGYYSKIVLLVLTLLNKKRMKYAFQHENLEGRSLIESCLLWHAYGIL